MNTRILASLQHAVKLYETYGLHAHSRDCILWINEARDAIVEVTPKPLRVGDAVHHKSETIPGNIVAINGEYAWVRGASKGPWTYRLADLVRVS